MDIIITFFRSIDGIPYYIMLVINIILIFAIIGYIGEKSSEQIIKLEMDTNVPNMGTNIEKNGSVKTSSKETIPKLEATRARAISNENLNKTK